MLASRLNVYLSEMIRENHQAYTYMYQENWKKAELYRVFYACISLLGRLL